VDILRVHQRDPCDINRFESALGRSPKAQYVTAVLTWRSGIDGHPLVAVEAGARPGRLAGEAEALRARLARQRGSSVPGASPLTGAEPRLLPLLSTHLSVPQIAAELFLSPSLPLSCGW
jgi:hypothetical protein